MGLPGMRLLRGSRGGLASAERQQQLLTQAFVDLVDFERGLALVAEYFQNGGTSFFRNFHARLVEMDDMHLQRLHQKVLVIPAARTRQCHSSLLVDRQYCELP